MTKLLSAFLFVGLFLTEITGINVENLEEIGSKIDTLPNGNEQSVFIKLDTPIHLYSNVYDHIYVRICEMKINLNFLLNLYGLRHTCDKFKYSFFF